MEHLIQNIDEQFYKGRTFMNMKLSSDADSSEPISRPSPEVRKEQADLLLYHSQSISKIEGGGPSRVFEG